MAETNEIAVGIDLGTTNSCVGVVRNGRVEIIANELGNRTTPSVVAFTDSEILVGEGAKEQKKWNLANTIYDCKRVIGRKFDDQNVQEYSENWPFKIKDLNNTPEFEVTYKGEKDNYTPEEISSKVLSKIKTIASEFTGVDVKNAVITVPAYFTDSQKQATIDAGKIAGLNVLRIINEPTAAALAYQVDRNVKSLQNILVFDLGGGTFDVVVLQIKKGEVNVQCVGGDMDLGGSNFDVTLLNYYAKQILDKYNVDISGNSRSLALLKDACEKAKISLTTNHSHRIQLDGVVQGQIIDFHISQSKFEDLCCDDFEKTIELVEETLDKANMDKSEIDEVILVGGSTRIPKVQELLMEFFDGKKLNKTINPDEAVAYGATLLAASLSGDTSIDEVNLLDVAPMSLGITVRGTETSVIIPRNTKIPVTKTVPFTTSSDYQRSVKIEVQEGEKKSSQENNTLGHFLLNNIQTAKKGIPQIVVTLSMDKNGILQVSAKDQSTTSENRIQISSYKGRLDNIDIDKLKDKSEKHKQDSEKEKKRLAARNSLDLFASQMKNGIRKKMRKGLVSNEIYTKIAEACSEALEWLEENLNCTASECQAKNKQLDEFCTKVLNGED